MPSSTLSPEALARKREKNRESERRRNEAIRKQIAELPQIECECGCGTLIPPLTLSGKPRRFADSHGSRSAKFRHGGPLAGALFPTFDEKPPCSEEDPEIFWDDELVEKAKSICARCPVMGQCLDWAIEHQEYGGVWGGLTDKERAKAGRAGGAKAFVHPAYTHPDKVKAIAHLTRHGVPADQIARRLGLNERTVHRYRARLRESA